MTDSPTNDYGRSGVEIDDRTAGGRLVLCDHAARTPEAVLLLRSLLAHPKGDPDLRPGSVLLTGGTHEVPDLLVGNLGGDAPRRQLAQGVHRPRELKDRVADRIADGVRCIHRSMVIDAMATCQGVLT